MDDRLKYGLVTAGLCIIFPPLFGIVAGIAIFCGIWYLVYKAMGG